MAAVDVNVEETHDDNKRKYQMVVEIYMIENSNDIGSVLLVDTLYKLDRTEVSDVY